MRALIGFVVLVILAGVLVSRREVGPCAGLPCRELPATVDVNGLFVKVTNQDHQDWRNVRVRVNDKYACQALDVLQQGKTALVKLAGCNAADGERFQPVRTAAVHIAVAAIQVDDTGEATSTFR